ncbi:MAG: hypothetical protein RIS92_2771 [Verrucomicrobiota bacterium]|jgi:hypothetical protein
MRTVFHLMENIDWHGFAFMARRLRVTEAGLAGGGWFWQ